MQHASILYSFRRCPYAIRARLALAYAGISPELREVVLRDKPAALLRASPKATVPVLVLGDGTVLDESLAIIRWALAQADPENWQSAPVSGDIESWIAANDNDFKHWLDRYKYADRHPDHSAAWYRGRAEPQLARLDRALDSTPWLHGERMGLVDVALFPFVRQFAMVDYDWFATSPYAALRRWLETWLEHPRFHRIMTRHAPWQPDQAPVRLL